MKTQFDELRPGNIISYRGKGKINSKQFAEIKDVKDISTGQMFWFKKRFEGDEEFVGYTEETNDIFLTSEILNKLGFQKTEEKGAYSLAGITIKSIGEVEGEDSMNLKLINHGWYVIPPYVMVHNEEELKNFVHLKTLHALQNYLHDLGIKLDYTVLRW